MRTKNTQQTTYKIRLFILVAILPLVIGVIYYLNSGHANLGFLAATLDNKSFNLCPTRISKIEETSEYSHISIVQENLKWKRSQPKEQTLAPTEMEKWLGRNCMVKLDAVVPFETARRESGKSLSQVQIHYIDGTTASLTRHPKGIYQTGDRAFTSNALDLALAQLATLE